MPFVTGFHLLPSTGEFTYDSVAYLGQRVTESSLTGINTYHVPGGSKTDYSYAIDQLVAAHPECTTVSLVCAWFCDGVTAGSNHVYPSTTYIGGTFRKSAGGSDVWQCSSLTQASSGLIAIPTTSSGSFIYGGTPSDQSIVRCVRDLKTRGFKVVFYPFLLMTSTGQPWRGTITYSPDLSSAATTAVNAFLGSAAASQFTPDYTNLTVAYSGSATDYTFRRMILHYANLMVVAGGVNLFVIGSELRALESVRGPAWTKAGTVVAGHAAWDYPFVAGLTQLAADVRGVFDAAGLTKSLSGLTNLIAYSADWSDWMGFQHPGEDGQWPHLDSLFASANVDFVSLDNYMPLSDWTTSDEGLDQVYWQSPVPAGAWPPTSPAFNGLGMTGSPSIYSKPYLKANIEGGEKFDWFYNDSTNGGAELDPLGSGLYVSQPQGDRASQSRNAYAANQQLLANKQVRWWWNNTHRAVYDTGSGWAPQGPTTPWVANSKPILFLEYGVPAVDRGTNQPNLFYAPASVASGTPYWSIWDSAPDAKLNPRKDDTIAGLGLEAIYEYWNTDTPSNNETVGGVVMLQWAFCCVWNWDARPFPTFPLQSTTWGDAANWPYGDWQNGRGPVLPPVAPSADPTPGTYPTFPTLATRGWSVHIRPKFATDVADHVSGRSTRRAARAHALYEIELTYEVLRAAAAFAELQTIAGFFETQGGEDAIFWIAPPGLGAAQGQVLATGDGAKTVFPLVRSYGAYSEPVLATSGVTAVYLNGVAQGSGWTVSTGYAPAITFASAPGAGVAVSADFGVLWLCRFSEDVADLENFMSLLWNWQSVKLQTVRP